MFPFDDVIMQICPVDPPAVDQSHDGPIIKEVYLTLNGMYRIEPQQNIKTSTMFKIIGMHCVLLFPQMIFLVHHTLRVWN